MRRLALAALFVFGCQDTPPAEGHLVLHVETDAPDGPLFATKRIELYRAEGAPLCAGCARDFPLIANPSIAVEGSASLAHICIFEARWGCVTGTSLETWASLPAVPADGGVDVTVSLLMSNVGTSVGTQGAPVGARLGGAQTLPRFTGADAVPCAGAPNEDDACIEGGAFWMGNVLVDNGLPGQVRRLVVTSPFYLDRREVSVARYRAAMGPEPVGVGHFSGTERGDNIHDYCTFTSEPGAHEDLPVNCLTQSAARAFCMQFGGDLPTEAQYEMAAAGPPGRLFPWGDDEPTCDDAVWGREDPELANVVGFTSNDCAAANSHGFPFSTLRDAIGRDVSAVGIRDLAGNIGEWMLDGYQQATGTCWSGHAILTDPRCDEPQDFGFGPTVSVRGGAWFLGRRHLAAATRTPGPSGGFSDDIGFRCARPAR